MRPEVPPPEVAQLRDIDVDELLDIDQPREQKPGGSWTEQQYIGPKQYDRLFVELTHRAPLSFDDEPKGPLGDVDRVELYTGGDAAPTTTIRKADTASFTYKAETVDDFEHDGRGPVTETKETLRVSLGQDVGAYVRDAHPFTVVLRARTSDGTLVFEKTFTGDEAGDYPTIVPPRPY